MNRLIGNILVSKGFWFFLGIIVGSAVQILFHWIVQFSQRANVKKSCARSWPLTEGN
jgi:hypothetical protein